MIWFERVGPEVVQKCFQSFLSNFFTLKQIFTSSVSRVNDYLWEFISANSHIAESLFSSGIP